MGKMGKCGIYRDYMDHMQLCSRNSIPLSDAWFLLDKHIKNIVTMDTFNKDYATFKGKDKND